MSPQSLFRQRAASVDNTTAAQERPRSLKHHAALAFLSLLLLYSAFVGFYRSTRKFFWYDEVSTIAITSQHSLTGIWNALKHAADSNPPPFYAAEELASKNFADKHLGYRVPAVLGFLCVPAALFWFVKTRIGNLPGLIAALLILLTSLYTRYASEARPYALVAGFLAMALVAWQRSDRPRNAGLLALLLAGATCLHYYAALALFPFVIGEIARTVRLRQYRLPVWAALGCACIPPLAFFPLLWQQKQQLGSHFWARLGVFSIPSLYLDLFSPENKWQVFAALGVIVIALGALVADIIQSNRVDRNPIPMEERIAMLGFILLPVVSYGATRIAGGGMTGRYALSAVLGISFAFACFAYRVGRFSAAMLLGLIFCAFVCGEGHYWMLHGGDLKAERSTLADNQILSELLQRSGIHGLPVVISGGLSYFPMAYYALLRKKGELLYLADPAKAVQYAKTDTLDRGLLIITAYLPVNVQRFGNFSRQHSQFLLYSINNNLWDWWPVCLRDEGYALQPVAAAQGRTLYLVDLTRKQKTQPQTR